MVGIHNVGVSGLGCIRTSNMVYIRGGIESSCSCDIDIIWSRCCCDCYISNIGYIYSSCINSFSDIFHDIYRTSSCGIRNIHVSGSAYINCSVSWDITGVVISIVVVIRFRILI